MVPFIQTSSRVYRVGSAQQYGAHATARLRKSGIALHDSSRPVVAYVNDNRWVIDCECGAGNLTDPAVPIAYCLACGATHRAVVFPDAATLVAIEAALIVRPVPRTRNWEPHHGETVDTLLAENHAHGVKGQR